MFLTWKTISRISRMPDQHNRTEAGAQAPQEERYLLKQEEMRLSATLAPWESTANPLPFTLLSMGAKDTLQEDGEEEGLQGRLQGNLPGHLKF